VKQNPFHLLGLPIGATKEDIVDRCAELAELARTDEERHAVLAAQRELITNPADRPRHEVLEVPGARYRDQEWDAFEHRNKRNPVDLKELGVDGVPLRRENFDFHAIIGMVLDDLLVPSANDIRPAVERPPVAPTLGDSPIEVSDVIFG
jgi:hypothetical protein